MNSPDHSTKGTPSPPAPGFCATATRQKLPSPVAPGRALRLRLLVGSGFQALFHPPCGVLFTFPSRYSCTIGGRLYSRLGGWSPLLPTGFLVSRGTRGQRHSSCMSSRRLRGSHPLWRRFPAASADSHAAAHRPKAVLALPHNPGLQTGCAPARTRFGRRPFRSPLLRASPAGGSRGAPTSRPTLPPPHDGGTGSPPCRVDSSSSRY